MWILDCMGGVGDSNSCTVQGSIVRVLPAKFSFLRTTFEKHQAYSCLIYLKSLNQFGAFSGDLAVLLKCIYKHKNMNTDYS